MDEQSQELIPENLIRTETALSRFPLHRLAKRGNVSIEINQTRPGGEVKTKWEVSYNSKYGQPGPLAYKLDTLIINRRIEEAGKPVPKFIKLGSLRDICEELSLGHTGDTNRIKKALRQNAFAGISAKITYTATDKTERTLEADFTRYSIIFTGEKFPNGSVADAVYLVLNDIYMQVLNSAQNRPLDYDYLKELAPAPQRFYEIVSYQIFAALKYGHPHAKLSYSDYCTYSTQTRYFDWEHVRKQMHKVHAPHLKSGYIAKVHFQEERNNEGQLDWMMLYVPGLKAKGEHTAAKRKPRQKRPVQQALPLLTTEETQPPETLTASPAPALVALSPELDRLVKKLIEHGMSYTEAERFVREDAHEVTRQLEYFPHQPNVKHPERFLSEAIRKHYDPPPDYLTFKEQERERQETQRLRACKFCHGAKSYIFRGRQRECSHDPEKEMAYRQELEAQEIAAPSKFEFQKMVEAKRAEARQKRKG